MLKNLIIVTAATGLLATSIAPAEAYWYRDGYGYRHYHDPGPVLGLVGGVIVGAATIATLPFAILAGATQPAPPPPPPPPPYYGPRPYGYGPPYGPPPVYYRGYYGPPPPRYYGY